MDDSRLLERADFTALPASVMGEPIYRRIGYREITRYLWFMVIP